MSEPMRRIRLTSAPPLPPLKAWFSISAIAVDAPISDLKSHLCSTLQILRDAELQASDIELLFDDFELLSESRVDVLRDGDLVCIHQKPKTAKRKAPPSQSPSRKKRRLPSPIRSPPHPVPSLKKRSPPAHSTSSEDSSSDDSSSDDSSDTSSTSSDSDSDSDTSSSPSVVKSSKPPLRGQKSDRPITHVPPGYGKPQTRSRNIRRRKKRQYEREADDTQAPASIIPVASPNAVPLGSKPALYTPPLPTESLSRPEPIAMMSLSNKNKRRGFKRSMAESRPNRIVFDTEDSTPIAASPVSGLSRPASRSHLPRLIPPSEKQDLGLLPPNMFVTSVDVEAGLWPRREYANNDAGQNGHAERSRRAKRRKTAPEEEYDEGNQVLQDTALPYDDESAAAMEATEDIDWDGVERRWTTLTKVVRGTNMSPGSLVGWKDLGIHPVTLTPEMLLSIARVVRCDESEVAVQQVRRPGMGAVSFGGHVEEEEEIEVYGWDDMSEWRAVLYS